MTTIELRSPAFDDHAPIADHYARDGDNASPALEWSGVPEETTELVVICEDPDAPGGVFTHWLLAGLDPQRAGIGEDETPEEAVVGVNDFGSEGYGGPQPPPGDEAHRYFFRVLALREPSGLSTGFEPQEVRQALEGREIGSGVLVGLYQR